MNDLTITILDFLGRLRRAKISYSLEQVRGDAIMVNVTVPGERWEIEFMDNGQVEIEIFKSDGSIFGKETLKELFEKYTD